MRVSGTGSARAGGKGAAQSHWWGRGGGRVELLHTLMVVVKPGQSFVKTRSSTLTMRGS